MRPLLRVLPLLLLAVSCARRVPSPLEALENAAADVESGGSEARSLALAGFHAWLLRADPERALTLFDRAAELDPAEPYALTGQHLFARRAADPQRSVDRALQLLETNPDHPLASLAARAVLEAVDTSPLLDEQIRVRGARALKAGASGDAAQLLRTALAALAFNAGDLKTLAIHRSAAGLPGEYTLLGPLSPFDTLDFDTPLAAEKTGELSGATRKIPFLDGRLNLQNDGGRGDVYVVATDVEVSEAGVYVVRSVAAVSHKLYLDGALIGERREFDRVVPTVMAKAVVLAPGRHRLLAKTLRDDRTSALALSLFRLDGRAATLKFLPAEGKPAQWGGVQDAEQSPGIYPTAREFAAALEPEVGGALARFLAVRDGLGRDVDGARALLGELMRALPAATPAVTVLSAELSLNDRALPTSASRGRAMRDLESALAKDPKDLSAQLLRSHLMLEDDRAVQAAAQLAEIDAKASTGLVHLQAARVALAQGIEPQAEAELEAALATFPLLCEANLLRYDLARKRDAAEAAAALLEPLSKCGNGRSRKADFLKQRGELEEAVKVLEAQVALQPAQASAVIALSNGYVSLRRYDEAVRVLQSLRRYWPGNAAFVTRIADVKELAGKPEEALKLRKEALALDGGDLTLRRAIVRAETGKELLAEHAIDGREAIRAYEAAGNPEEAAAVYVLDAATVKVDPDGSIVNRIHTIQKALEQSGVQEIAEVQIPAGAQVLAVRTIKPDGTVLEPERIEGKESVSLPGVSIGDYVEAEYLLAESPRSAAQPGFTAANFYFQIAHQPNHWTRYTVIAPASMNMAVDPHNLPGRAPKIERKGELDVLHHEERNVPPYIPEPDSPPSPNEYLPFVVVGAGTEGNDELVKVYGDAFLRRSQRTFEIDAFAREAAGDRKGLEAVQALHAAVMQRIQGRDAGLGASASSTLAQNRGSRLLLLKAALESLGIPARVALVRSFAADRSEYKFPNSSLLPYAALRVEPEGLPPVWLDTGVRFGPFGELPEPARESDAWLMPEPKRPLVKDRTPKGEVHGKLVKLKLSLSQKGELSGEGSETYRGFDGAQLSEALESMNPEARTQALQGALGRYFGGAELSALEVQTSKAVGDPLVVKYRFKAARFARVDGNSLTLGPLTFPSNLGRRYVQMGARSNPLYIDSTEATTTEVELSVPAGFALKDGSTELTLQSAKGFGAFSRKESQQGNTLRISEDFRLDMARIPPGRYGAFAQFAGEVDLLQLRDLVLVK